MIREKKILIFPYLPPCCITISFEPLKTFSAIYLVLNEDDNKPNDVNIIFGFSGKFDLIKEFL